MNTSFRCGLAVSALALAGTLLPGAAAAQGRNMDNVQITPHQLADGIYYLEGQGGNIGLSVGEDGVIMIDDQFAPLTERILAAIRNISDGPIRFVINTHMHPDHIGGNENLGKMGLLILARDQVRVRLAASQPKEALPVLTYDDPITIHLNGGDVHVVPLPPAHTDGDSYIQFVDADVIHLGDVFRTTAFPVIDRGNGGTVEGTIQALALLAGIGGPNTQYIPGHGVVSKREDLVEFRDMVVVVRDRVASMIADGASLEQVLAAHPTQEYEAKWGDPEGFLTSVYQDLTGAD